MPPEDDRTVDESLVDSQTDTEPTIVTTEAEFRNSLSALVLAAIANEVDVRGSWPVVSPDETTSLDVEITRVATEDPTN